MAAAKCIDTSSLEIMYSTKEERVFIRDLTDEILQMVFDKWWTSMNVETKTTIVWSGSRHAAAWRFYKHCAKTENGCPGIICIVCNTVLVHPSENGTSTMAKHLQSKTHKAELNKLTESDVSLLTDTAGDEQALAVLKKKGSQGVMVASSSHQTQAD
jgi:hypothetical protein